MSAGFVPRKRREYRVCLLLNWTAGSGASRSFSNKSLTESVQLEFNAKTQRRQETKAKSWLSEMKLDGSTACEQQT